jgi:hypothetical protein
MLQVLDARELPIHHFEDAMEVSIIGAVASGEDGADREVCGQTDVARSHA